MPYQLNLIFYTKQDREVLKNIATVRQYCRDLIEERKKNSSPHGADFLSILLEDEGYREQPEVIIDECITFFLAGSQTVKVSNVNMIMHLALRDDVRAKVIAELKEKVLKEDINAGQINIMTAFNLEKIQELNYFSMFFHETLRLEPPIINSGFMKVTEPISINGVNFSPHDCFVVSIHTLHHDPDQWIDHNSFIPERFDPQSKYYLTPSGQKRHPFAFSPFLGGKRICIGKTFAEIVAKIVVPSLISRLHFEFEDPDQKLKEKPILNVEMVEQPVIMMKVKRAQL